MAIIDGRERQPGSDSQGLERASVPDCQQVEAAFAIDVSSAAAQTVSHPQLAISREHSAATHGFRQFHNPRYPPLSSSRDSSPLQSMEVHTGREPSSSADGRAPPHPIQRSGISNVWPPYSSPALPSGSPVSASAPISFHPAQSSSFTLPAPDIAPSGMIPAFGSETVPPAFGYTIPVTSTSSLASWDGGSSLGSSRAPHSGSRRPQSRSRAGQSRQPAAPRPRSLPPEDEPPIENSSSLEHAAGSPESAPAVISDGEPPSSPKDSAVDWEQHCDAVAGTHQYRCTFPNCPRSDQPFPSKKAVETHIKGKHLHLRSNICPVPGCGKAFSRAFDLKRHLRSHSEERPFVCPVCHIAYKRADMLSRHRGASKLCRSSSAHEGEE